VGYLRGIKRNTVESRNQGKARKPTVYLSDTRLSKTVVSRISVNMTIHLRELFSESSNHERFPAPCHQSVRSPARIISQTNTRGQQARFCAKKFRFCLNSLENEIRNRMSLTKGKSERIEDTRLLIDEVSTKEKTSR
jgi:hypothetical protein